VKTRLLWPSGVVLVAALYSWIPLLGSREVYMRGDSAAQFGPTWFHLGQLVRDGGWPTQLDPDSFSGGNYAAEALFGIYNPVNLLIWLAVSSCSDLLVAVTLVKTCVLAALALGTYLVAREYDAAPWAAAAVSTALPFSGFTLWWDAGSWPAGLIAFAYAPWVWWAFRRALRGTLNPLWAFLVGILAITQGNPYGTLAVVVVGAGLLVEGLVTGNRPGMLRLTLLGGCVAAFLPLVYLPLLETSALAARSNGPIFGNTGRLRPEFGDLLGLSSPTYVPGIDAVTGPMPVPAMYFCWFLLPLLPWLRYDVLRRRARELSGIAAIGAVYLMMAMGPSELWLFRWPLRLVEYTYLALGVGFAVVLSKGLRRDHARRRLLATTGLLAFSAYHAWAEHPRWTEVAFGGTAMLVALTVVLLAWHRWAPAAPAALALLLVGGTGLALAGQALVFHENEGSRGYHVPTDLALLEDRFGHLDGRVMQFVDLQPLQKQNRDRALRKAWDSYLPGGMYHVAGVDSVNNYTGMGFRPFERRFCMHYEGFTRPCGYARVWRPAERGQPSMADLLKLQTIVVDVKQTVGITPAKDWQTVSVGRSVVLERTSELPFEGSRLSWAEKGVTVTGARSVDDHHEELEVAAPTGGTLVFALLAWPGYTATLDEKRVEVQHNEAGLLMIDLPKGADGRLEIGYRTPGLNVGLAAAGLGTLGALTLALLPVVRRRREAEDAPAPAAPSPDA